MEKYIFNKRGTRQIINSGWKEFDRQTNLITTGNALCNTQVSSFIRPWMQKERNGYVNPEGHLLKFDLKQFEDFHIPADIMSVINDVNRRESVILYMFFTTGKNDKINPFCWVVTGYHHDLIDYSIVSQSGQQTEKRIMAFNEIIKFITE